MNRSDYRLYAITGALWLAAFLGLGGTFVG